MLVGRDRERHVMRGLLAAARVGQGSALVLSGEAGIGKTALLEDAVEAAAGMRLLRATGTESESGLPFAALMQLLRPALVHLDRIPAPQADALAAALALRPGGGGDRFAVGAATLSLLSRFAEDQPVAVVVDDAHLLDPPSAQALAFAARRLAADPVVLLAAVRSDAAAPLAAAGLPVLRVGGLSAEAAAELVSATGHRLDAETTRRLYATTGGNPLALVELADDADDLTARPPGAPLPVPATLARTFGRRADQLSPDGRTALLVAAVGGGDLALIVRAGELLGVPAAALEEAEDAGLLTIESGTVAFRHPLVRSAVYTEAAPGARRAVHRALAAAVGGADADRRAWHLGEAALGPDDETADALDAAAARARDRGAHAVAEAAFARAAGLSTDPAGRVRRLVLAAESAWRAGLAERAGVLLARAAEHPLSPALQARTAALHGTIAARTGAVEEARDVLVAAGRAAAAHDADAAIRLLADAILACFFLADTATVADAAERIDRLAGRAATDTARWLGDLAIGIAGVLTGRSGGPDRVRRAVTRMPPVDPLVRDPGLAPWLVLGPLFLRESTTGRQLVQTVVDDLRRRTDLGTLPYLLFQIARDQATTDHWDLAEENYTEGIALARETGSTTDLAACLAGLAWLHARQGREQECRVAAEEVLALCGTRHLGLLQAWAHVALGELELGQGRAEAALTRFADVDALLARLGLEDVDLSPAPEVVEALIQLGRTDEARDRADRYAADADEKGQPWALARAARALALTASEAELDERIGAALDLHARTPDSFETARTRLLHGTRLRRDRRRADARGPLRAALACFEVLGAAPWADRAAVELRATGETVHRRVASALRDLTPQELQIARMLAAGRTTRETAAALFLSPKTVEYHLRHVYIKLGVSSRAQLAERLAAES